MIDLDRLQLITRDVTAELQKAASGHTTSFSFLRHQLSSHTLVKEDEVFQVLAIGGSVLKSALCKKTSSQIELLSAHESALPLLSSQEVLFEIIEKELHPQIQVLGINFAYPLQPLSLPSHLDGILLQGSKEHTFAGLIGEPVGSTLSRHLRDRFHRNISVAVANDTICLLLSGLTQYPPESLAAGIIGTGINFALFLDAQTAVNLESANFHHFPMTAEGKAVDKASREPGRARFEKETAGAYLYQHFNYHLQKEQYPFSPLHSTKELKELSQKHVPHVSALARTLLEKSAALVACQIAGITLFQQKNLTFVMEGSFYWEGGTYKELIRQYVEKLSPEFSVTFARIEQSTLLGAAKLVA